MCVYITEHLLFLQPFNNSYISNLSGTLQYTNGYSCYRSEMLMFCYLSKQNTDFMVGLFLTQNLTYYNIHF